MKEFPTCRFLTTAFSQSDEDFVPVDLKEQLDEFYKEAMNFLMTEHYFNVYNAFDTLLEDLNDAFCRKKGSVKMTIKKSVSKIEKYLLLNEKRLDHPDLFRGKEHGQIERRPTGYRN